MDKGIVSRAVASLVTQGYLKRQASDQDGRVSHLYMTVSGRETFTQIAMELEQTGATGETLLAKAKRDALLENLDHIIANFPR
jgi:DNA-binding MarR family transcriptional regulator